MKRQFWGLIFTAVGIMALLQVMGIQEFGLAFWPVVLAMVGVAILGSSFRRVSIFGLALGLWVGGIGVADILFNAGVNTAGITGGTIAANGWPIMLVATGVSLFFGKKSWRFVYQGGGKEHRNGAVGDVRIGNHPWTLDGDLTVEHGIGDVKVDLTTAQITEGIHHIRARLGLGDLVIRVPDDVNVDVQCQLGLGDCDVLGTHRSGIAPHVSQSYTVPDSPITLKISAQCGLGDLDIVQRPAGTIRVIKA
jgi:lia operon protein LiaF